MTFGIPVQVLPITVQGEKQLEHHKLWLESRRNIESAQPSDRKGERCVVPGPMDIVFGRDALARAHLGNLRFRKIIHDRQERYDHAASHDERSVIAADIVLGIKESGGRFLKLEKASWIVVNDETARDKVTNAFRSRRSDRRVSNPKYRGLPSETAGDGSERRKQGSSP